MARGLTLLQRATVSTGGSSIIVFPGIPQTGYTDLVIEMSIRGSSTTQYDYTYFCMNGMNSHNISEQRDAYTLNGSQGYENYTGTTQHAFVTGDYSTGGQYGITSTTVPRYTAAVKKVFFTKTITESAVSTMAIPSFTANMIPLTESIFSLHFWISNVTFKAGTVFSLYGRSAFGTTPSSDPAPIAPSVVGTGGTILQKEGYAYHYFGFNSTSGDTSNSTFTLASAKTCDILVVSGGGAGGGRASDGTGNGGGGAGGYKAFTGQALTSGSYTVTVGRGGTGGTTTGQNGFASTFQGLASPTAGGGGGTRATLGNTGGSGGGTGSENTSTPAQGTAGQGFAGGTGASAPNYGGGGGGGAGGAGANGSGTVGGAGGVGIQWLDGNYYAAGGSGGTYNGGSQPTVARGGGAAGGDPITTSSAANNGYAATFGTGGGGGGSSSGPSGTGAGGTGGSGIIIVRYPI